MGPMQTAALERLELAIKDRGLQGFTAIRSEDVIAVALIVPEAKWDDAIKMLVAGARNNKAGVEIWQSTERLAHLVAKVKGG